MDVDCEGSTSFVASDNYKVGEMLADAVIEQLDGKGKIAIIDGITVTSLKDRTDGFMDKIKDTDIEVVAEQRLHMQGIQHLPQQKIFFRQIRILMLLLVLMRTLEWQS